MSRFRNGGSVLLTNYVLMIGLVCVEQRISDPKNPISDRNDMKNL